jgi:putative heme-binding domain-containing protein
VQAAGPKLAALAGSSKASEGLRAAALEGLAALGGEQSKQTLIVLADGSDNSPATRLAAVTALIPLDQDAAAAQAVKVLATGPPESDPTGLLMSFLVRKGGPEALAGALKDQKLPPDLAKLAARVADGSGGKNPALVEAIRKAGGLGDRMPIPTGKDRETLLAEVARSGNAARGEIIFRDKQQACLRCHAVAGAGGQVGPSLESIGASAPVDYLLDSMLEPDKAVKENYHSLVVATADGQIYSGIKVRQSDSELVLRDAEDREIIIPAAEIEDQKNGGSLMPAGQTDALTRTELVDLIRFLSELGKVGPYAVGKEMVARRWQVLVQSADTAEELRSEGSVVIARDDPRLLWTPAYSKVNGRLPAADIPQVWLNAGDKNVGVARCQVAASGQGEVTLHIDGIAEGLQFFVDGKTLLTAKKVPLTLSPGTHTLTFIVPRDQMTDGLRCELTEAPSSPVKARFVLGK